MRRLAIAGVALALAGCGDDGDGASAPADTGVDAADFKFAPSTTRVSVGTTVRWTNTGATDHTVKGAGFFSRDLGLCGLEVGESGPVR